ncbi:Xaa-Pro peptidase family protein [Wukongibacter baidiensis]|uniref:M24 family metallopeptidase n=1 Tax=Wukongibacter baidiensis TaxID=1723361 RepID=UPI003D7F60CA
MRYIPKTEIDSRIEQLQKMLCENDIDCALIFQNADKLYFAGTTQNGYLFVPSKGEPLLLVGKILERVRKESSIEKIVELQKFKDLPEKLKDQGYSSFNKIGLETDVLPANLFQKIDRLFSPSKLTDISLIIRSIRMVKSPYELEIIRRAGKMAAEIFTVTRENLKDGMKEFDMISIIEEVSRSKGHPGYIRGRSFNQEYFYIHFTSGIDSSAPSYGGGPLGGLGTSVAYPQGSSNRIIGRNEPIVLDYESWVDGYMADMTRTFCIGKLPKEMIKAYDVSLEIQEIVKNSAKPGVKCGDIYQLAREIVIKRGFEKHFMGMDKQVAFIAHGVGLEVDELPVLANRNSTLLKKNMVIAIEPKFVFEGGAIGIENTYIVGEDGLENITVFDEDIQYCT